MTSLKTLLSRERGGSFAVARRAVEKDGAAGVEGRTGLLDDAVVECQIAHDLANAVEGDELVGELLHVDPVVELFEGDWSRTGVAQASQGIKGPAAAFFGEGVAQVDRVVGIARTEGLKQLALDGHADEIENDVIGQLDGVDELAGGFESIAIDQFQQKSHQVDFVDARWRGYRLARLGCDAGRNRAFPG